MSNGRALLLAAGPLLIATLAAPGLAQQVRTIEDDPWCDNSGWGDQERYCEVREVTLPARDRIAVNARPNGGITVEGWDRNEIQLRAKVQGYADTESDARDIVSRISLDTGGTISADGPRTGRDEGWSVSYRLMVPRRSNLDLESVNGGIAIEEVTGRIDFRTTNGGVHLTRVEGDVRGRTTNGGLDIELGGDAWDGEGLDVRTTNGGVKLQIPDGYSARLESGTVNGPLRIDFPITVQGRIDRKIEATLGDGGKTIRVMTTNGGVTISRG